MKKPLLLTFAISIRLSCEIYFPYALSSNTKIKGFAKLKNIDNILSSPIIEGKFICKTSFNPSNALCKSENYDKKLSIVIF